MKIRCAIVDDEQPARKLLINYCNRIPEIELVGDFKSPLLTRELINNGEIDLMFLDIQMQEIKGTDFLRTIQNSPFVIMTTAYSEYALEGYELDIVDYLLKPFPFERFLQAFNKVSKMLQLSQQAKPELTNDILKVRTDRKLHFIPIQDIVYLEGLKEYVSIYTTSGERIIALDRMKNFEQKLNHSFIRTHRSYIVQIDKIKYIDNNSVNIGEKNIPIGVSYKETVFSQLGTN